jgi:hypothetical protein
LRTNLRISPEQQQFDPCREPGPQDRDQAVDVRRIEELKEVVMNVLKQAQAYFELHIWKVD